MDYFHGTLGHIEAEERLRTARMDKAYLVRESVVKEGPFILSYITNERLKHVQVQSAFSEFNEAVLDIEFCVSRLDLQHPVAPPAPVTRYWRPWSSAATAAELTCPACSRECSDKAAYNSHMRNHIVVLCDTCDKYKIKNTINWHKNHCKVTPELICEHAGCDYTTRDKSNMTRHKACVT